MTDESRADGSESGVPLGPPGRRQKGVFAAAIVMLAAGALYAALAIVVRVDQIFFPGNSVPLPGPLGRVPGLDSVPGESSPVTDRINILILGLDRRPHHSPDVDGPPRSDSIYVLSVDPLTKTGGLLAIPRDLYVNIPNPEGKDFAWSTRINTAYQYGAVYKYPGGGPALARDTVERLLKIKIHYYIVVDWVGFANVIDEMHGIELTVTTPLYDVEGFNPRNGHSFLIDIPAGRQPMDGITALAYSRYRGDEEGDVGRIKRQQQVMQAAMDKALSLGWLGNGLAMWNKYRASFDTDIAPARLPGLIALARQVGPDRLTMVSIAGEHGEAVRRIQTIYGEDVLLPVWEKAAPIVQSVIYDRRLREEGAQVKVVNATLLRGRAQHVATQLTRWGLAPGDVAAVEPPTVERRAETVVIDYTGKPYTAERIRESLGLPKPALQQQPAPARAPGDPDIVVIVGQDLKLFTDDPDTGFEPR